MIVPLMVRQLFDTASPYVVELSRRVTETVFNYCCDHGYAFSSRPKTVESVAEKIETGRYRRWSDIDDLFACTVVIPTLAEESKVIDFLGRAFHTGSVRRRHDTRKAPDVFRFEATRFIGHLHRPAGIDPKEPLFALPFEIQVRSAFEHAWSATTHALVYKSPRVDWRRLRLAAQLKAAVEQLDSLVLAFEESVGHIESHHWPEIAARTKIVDCYSQLVDDGKIPRELAPKDWSRFAENVWNLLRATRRTANPGELEALANQWLNIIRSELDAMSQDEVPRSISIFQFTLGVLAKEKIVGGVLQSFYPLVTPELVLLYSDVNKITTRFEV
jgi:ppGpp synthetase/RelA/SpoT-type nucleotidyltranferase